MTGVVVNKATSARYYDITFSGTQGKTRTYIRHNLRNLLPSKNMGLFKFETLLSLLLLPSMSSTKIHSSLEALSVERAFHWRPKQVIRLAPNFADEDLEEILDLERANMKLGEDQITHFLKSGHFFHFLTHALNSNDNFQDKFRRRLLP